MSRFESLSLVFSIFGALLSVVVLVVLVRQLRLFSTQVADAKESLALSREVAEREALRLRRQATFDFEVSTMDRVHAYWALRPALGTPDHEAFVRLSADRSSAEHLATRNYLSHLETLAAGVNLGVFDVEVVDRILGRQLLRAWTDNEVWIIPQREILDQPSLYCEIETCVLSLGYLSDPPLSA